jgi:hypothetical protein
MSCTRRASLLTVAQAHAVASTEGKKCTIAGYYVPHFEGDEIEAQPGDQTGDGVALEFGPKFAEEKPIGKGIVHALGGRHDQKYVFVTGMLKRGFFRGLMRVFMEVEEIGEHDYPPEAPKGFRQFEESNARKG